MSFAIQVACGYCGFPVAAGLSLPSSLLQLGCTKSASFHGQFCKTELLRSIHWETFLSRDKVILGLAQLASEAYQSTSLSC